VRALPNRNRAAGFSASCDLRVGGAFACCASQRHGRRAPDQHKKAAPGRCGSRFLRYEYGNYYWVGRISCENPMVLTERNDGVRGGKHAGPRVKLVSKV
jgi:hypothetical protein